VSRATLISRVVFALLVLATFTAFFAAQRLKRTDPLVYSVNVKKYVSPNNDDLRDRARLRFRTKKADAVTVDIVDRNGTVVRTLADRKELRAGVHNFQWNGRYAAVGDQMGVPVPDGAYRVRIAMARNGRTFVPDKFFVVDTVAPRLVVNVAGENTVSALRGRPRNVKVQFSGISASKRVEFLVYRVAGQRTLARPVAGFANVAGASFGEWDLTVGAFRLRRALPGKPRNPCAGRLQTRGRARPAPSGKYVIIVRACDAAGNIGNSSDKLPPQRGSTGGEPGVTLRGVEIAPPTKPSIVGAVASFGVNPPPGGYTYKLKRVGGETEASGRARGATLRLRMPRATRGLYELTIKARRAVSGQRGSARSPVVVSDRRRQDLLVAYPSIAWQATNPVDVNGDGYGDGYEVLPPGKQLRVRTDRTLASPTMPPGFDAREGALANFLSASAGSPAYEATTDFALAAAPARALKGRKAVLFAGDERWITPQLGVALRKFVEQGGRVAFFAPDAFRRTVKLTPGEMTGPSERRERDIFGESTTNNFFAPAPVVPFADSLGLLRGPTGLFTGFEQSRARARSAEVLTSAGREEGRPALVAYKLQKGMVIRVGVSGWQAQSVGPAANANVAYTTQRILEELVR
jgi:hypothetical protein